MLADPWGVGFGFNDATGAWFPTNATTRARVRRSLGAPDDEDAPAPISQSTVCLSIGTPYRIDQRTTLVTEEGAEIHLDAGDPLPGDLPVGYHALRSGDRETRLILSPTSCAEFKGPHTWGWAVQLYAMRSRSSWGVGEFRDLAMLAEWSTFYGSGMVLVNPLHAAAPVSSQQPSPYFPTSRCYRNPLYLAIERVPGYSDVTAEIAPIAERARALNDDRRIDRDAVFLAKYEALDVLWNRWRRTSRGPEHARFDSYTASEGDALTNFATFSTIVEQRHESWMQWPAALRRPDSVAVVDYRAAHGDRVQFHRWVQWLIDEQLETAAPGVELMTDLAIGVDRGGADAWCWQDSFALDMSVGAPPDAFNTQGQNWGLPPFDPWRLKENGYEPFIRTVRSAFRHAKGLRIDHVMGLFRLYWIPEGSKATDGCYVYTPFQDLLGIVAIESQRAGAYVVGEDLGTVESYVREELAAAKIFSYKLRQFEPGRSSEFPFEALAAVTTHDLPTIPGFWTRSDVATQTAMGLQPNVEGTEAIRDRLAEWSGVDPSDGAESTDAVVLGVYRELAASPCAVITATLDDALGVEERPNMPGTIDEWPNWRIALPVPLETILGDRRVRDIATILQR
jgi:4-alpha-glucanotransferase